MRRITGCEMLAISLYALTLSTAACLAASPLFSAWDMVMPRPPYDRDAAADLITIVATDSYMNYALTISDLYKPNHDFISVIKSYHHEGRFRAVSFIGSQGNWYMIIAGENRGREARIESASRFEISHADMNGLWVLLEKQDWEHWPPYRNLRENDETSPSPLYIQVKRGNTVKYHCVSFPENDARCLELWSEIVRLIDAYRQGSFRQSEQPETDGSPAGTDIR